MLIHSSRVFPFDCGLAAMIKVGLEQIVHISKNIVASGMFDRKELNHVDL